MEIENIKNRVNALQGMISTLTEEMNMLQLEIQDYTDRPTITVSELLCIPRNEKGSWMMLSQFCRLTGYTENAIRKKISAQVLNEGRHYRKSEIDGKLWIHYDNFLKLALPEH